MILSIQDVIVLMIIPFILFLIGVLLIFLSLAREGTREVKGGGVILIGPIPIIFSLKNIKGIILSTLILVLLILILIKLLATVR